MSNLAYNLDRFSQPLSTERTPRVCPGCGDEICRCYTVGLEDEWDEDRERMMEFIDDSWDRVGEPI